MPDRIGELAAMDGYTPEEADFQFGIRATPWFSEFTQQHGEPNLNDPNYDYRAAWKAGARPDVRDPGDSQYHWPSQFKGPEHPNRFVDGIDTITGQPMTDPQMAQQAREAAAATQRSNYTSAMARPQESNRLTKVAGAVGSLPYAIGSLAAAPGQTMSDNPYQPGTEEHQFFEDQRRSNTYRIGPEAGVDIVTGGMGVAPRGALGMAGGRMGSVLDPLWSPISKTKLEKPLSEMQHGYIDQRIPVPKIVDPAKLQGGSAIFTPSDLSRGNVTVNKIDTIPIDPVTAHGGVSFPEANPGMAWASETPIARKLDNQAAALAEKTEKPVYIMPMTMSPQGIDASHHVASPLAQLVQEAPIAKTNVEKFDRMMRKVDKDWPGIKDKDFRDYIENLEGGMKLKSYMANRMALGEWREKGFPSVAAVRHAMSEPALISAPRYTTGMAISQYTPGKGLLETSHPSYSKGVAGQHMGQLASLLPFDVAAPDISKGLAKVNAANFAAGKEVAITPRYHLEKPTPGVPTHQVLDQQWLDRVMERERRLAREGQ